MQKTIKVRIDKCTNPLSWYNSSIGQEEVVVDYSDVYYATEKGLCLIKKSDCTVISDTKVEWECVKWQGEFFKAGKIYIADSDGMIINENGEVADPHDYPDNFRKLTDTPQHDRTDKPLLLKDFISYEEAAEISKTLSVHGRALYHVIFKIKEALKPTKITLSTSQVIDLDALTEEDKTQLRKI